MSGVRPTSPASLAPLFHRRWAAPILAELAADEGCKLATLTYRLGSARQPVRDALDTLIELGLVMPNPGYGHPLRPEYVLTRAGERAAPECARLMSTLRSANAMGIGLRKWAVPTMAAVQHGAARFGEIACALPDATDRALSLTLAGLDEATLIVRSFEEGERVPIYALTKPGLRIARAAMPIRLPKTA